MAPAYCRRPLKSCKYSISGLGTRAPDSYTNLTSLLNLPFTTIICGMFLRLSTAFSKQLTNLMLISEGMVRMLKALFYLMFKKAWNKSVSEKSLLSA